MPPGMDANTREDTAKASKSLSDAVETPDGQSSASQKKPVSCRKRSQERSRQRQQQQSACCVRFRRGQFRCVGKFGVDVVASSVRSARGLLHVA